MRDPGGPRLCGRGPLGRLLALGGPGMVSSSEPSGQTLWCNANKWLGCWITFRSDFLGRAHAQRTMVRATAVVDRAQRRQTVLGGAVPGAMGFRHLGGRGASEGALVAPSRRQVVVERDVIDVQAFELHHSSALQAQREIARFRRNGEAG